MKDCRFAGQLSAENDFHRKAVVRAYSRNVSEKEHWPSAKEVLAKFTSQADDRDIALKSCFEKWAVWSEGLRPSTTTHINEEAVGFLMQKADAAAWGSNDPAVSADNRSVLALLQTANALWTDAEPLKAALEKAAGFSAQIKYSDMRGDFHKSVADFLARGDQQIEGAVVDMYNAFPIDQGSTMALVVDPLKSENRIQELINMLKVLVAFLVTSFPRMDGIKLAELTVKRVGVEEDTEQPDYKAFVELTTTMKQVIAFANQGEAFDAWKRKGSTVEERVEADKALGCVKTLIEKHAAVLHPLPENHPLKQNSIFEDTTLEVKQGISDHADSYIAKGQPHLTAKIEAVQPWLFGSAEGKNWKEHIDSKITWPEFKAAASETIFKMDVKKQGGLIRDCHQAYNHLKARFIFFQRTVPEEQASRVETLLHQARLTLVERYLFGACVTWTQKLTPEQLAEDPTQKSQFSKAQDSINAQIKGFEQANIKPSEVCTPLWAFCNEILNGKELK